MKHRFRGDSLAKDRPFRIRLFKGFSYRRQGSWKKYAFQIAICIILYVLLGNSRSVKPNPFIPGAIIAVNMIVPVIAGILFGKTAGFLTGLFGTLLNALSPVGNVYEFVAIIPHAIMGFTAGIFRELVPSPIVAFSIFLGHFLNLVGFLIFGLIGFDLLLKLSFVYGILYETFVGVIAVVVIVTIYRLGFEK